MTTRLRLLAEHLLLFYGSIVLLIALDVPGGPIPVLLVAGAAVSAYLWRFDRHDLWRARALRGALPGMLGRWTVFSLLAVAAVAMFDRTHLFDMPREQPWLWLAVITFYPLLSVYPQELLYRAFLLRRYAPLAGEGRGAAAMGAAAFGFAHLIFGNVPAVVLTITGGWLFARRFQRTRSLLVVSVEHALYGITIFTVGLGRLFYHGAGGLQT
ncbi:type II CAAX prenyl endopeptidase Rce1 family protein [Actinoplanes sp. DH11]|uniref:CPBP family glutamic-type intramembrane protease n=1 Tax=Actinoplanes sp. DH11 TaxID=2857011 RepID=UPI001E29561B|nr:CPBP family glutamic-type intramembrane protease [Actinoplanes sp. DH11]